MVDMDLPTANNNHHTTALHTTAASGWNLRLLFSTEPTLAMITIEAASAKHGNENERINALYVSLKKADKLIGEDAHDPRLRSQDAWDFFSDYMFDLLGL